MIRAWPAAGAIRCPLARSTTRIATAMLALLVLWTSGVGLVRAESTDASVDAVDGSGDPADRTEAAREQRRMDRQAWRELSPKERRQLREQARNRWRHGSPGEREAIREEYRDLGLRLRDELTPRERRELRRRIMAAERHRVLSGIPAPKLELLRDQLRDMTPAERRAVRARIRDMTIEDRQALRERIEAYRDLDAASQQELRDSLHKLLDLGDEERRRIEENAERWRALGEEERAALRAQMERLRALPPGQQQQLLDRALSEAEADSE